MGALLRPEDALIYQSADRSITLLDIPRSISLAQGTQSLPFTAQIFSSKPPQVPYPSIEPTTERGKVNLQNMRHEANPSATFPEVLLRQALEIISDVNHGVWYFERKLLDPEAAELNNNRKSKRENAGPTNIIDSIRHDQSYLVDDKADETLSLGGFHDPVKLDASECLTGQRAPVAWRIRNRVVHNSCSQPVFLHPEGRGQIPHILTVPPHASFFLSKIDQNSSLAFSMGALTMFPESGDTAGRGQFDFILLDPPWENRSAKRASKYATMQESNPMEALQMTLGQHIGPDGLVACWITNKPKVRDQALSYFENWDVELVEEWAWLKITTNGEPVTEIEGLWRKPYEILLIGRKSKQNSGKIHGDPPKRVIVGVPDLHSRKPNLKALVEPMFPTQYRALEIFARNLTAGWWAWGDEVLKYAHFEQA